MEGFFQIFGYFHFHQVFYKKQLDFQFLFFQNYLQLKQLVHVFHFLIHITRSIWFIGSVFFVLENQFERKTLVLYEDEIKILEQLSNGKIYQKEVEGFSENTVYRKLKAARERNGNITKEELLKLFKKEFPEKVSYAKE